MHLEAPGEAFDGLSGRPRFGVVSGRGVYVNERAGGNSVKLPFELKFGFGG